MTNAISEPATGGMIEVVFPDDVHVVRVPVEAGETIVLPFPADADLMMREASGNLAVKERDGDDTVVLKGFIEASNDQYHPIVVEGRDHVPLDVATILAATDPALDVTADECACGPTAEPMPNDGGAILRPFELGAHLGGFEAAGRQDDAFVPGGIGSLALQH